MANEYLRPTTATALTWSNSASAYDGTDTGDNSTYASETAGDSTETWSGFSAAGQTYTALDLHVVHEFVGNASNDAYTLEYEQKSGVLLRSEFSYSIMGVYNYHREKILVDGFDIIGEERSFLDYLPVPYLLGSLGILIIILVIQIKYYNK